MNKKVIIFLVTIILLFLMVSTACAASIANLEFVSSKNSLKAGESFTVTISASSEYGINGIDAFYSYDKDILELVEASLVDSTNWANLSSDNQITLLCNSSSKITQANIYTFTFKVKNNVQVGSTTKISFSNILLDTDLQTNSQQTIESKEITISIISNTSNLPSGTDGSNTTNNDNNNNDSNRVNNNNANNDSNEVNGNNANNDSNEVNGNKANNDSNEVNGNKANNDNNTNISSGKLPQTGKNTILIFFIILILCVLAIFSRVAYKKYKF